MKDLSKWIGKLMFWGMAIALITYAASRTLDFVSNTLPQEDRMVGYLALAATTIGAIAWLLTFLQNSEGIAQKGIALVMIVLDVGGEIVLFTVDTLMRSGEAGLTRVLTAEEVRMTVMGMSILIGLNIIATFAFHIMDIENMENMEEQLSDWKIRLAIQKAKREKATSIAEEIANREAEKYAKTQRQKDRTDRTLPKGVPVMAAETEQENLADSQR